MPVMHKGQTTAILIRSRQTLRRLIRDWRYSAGILMIWESGSGRRRWG